MKRMMAGICLTVGMMAVVPLTVRAQGPTNVNMTVTNNVTIDWLWTTQYMARAISAGNGSVSGHTDDWIDSGSNATVQASANPHCHFTYWTGVPAAVTNNNPAVFTMDDFYTNIVANFDWDMKTVTVYTAYETAMPGTTNVPYGTILNQTLSSSVVTTSPGRVRVRVKEVRVTGNDSTVSP